MPHKKSRWIHAPSLWLALVLPAIVLLPWDVAADRSLRCNGRLVSIGAPKAQVEEICGPPDHIAQWEVGRDSAISQRFDYETERYMAPKLIIGPIHMERWTYNFGSTRFIRYLEFQNGKLIRIETGDKGRD